MIPFNFFNAAFLAIVGSVVARRCIMYSRERRGATLDQELREPSAAKSPW
jgi:hypothetical protein